MVDSERSTGSVSARVITTAPREAFSKENLSSNEREVAKILEISDTRGNWRPDTLVLDRSFLDRIVDGGEITEEELVEAPLWAEWEMNVSDAMAWWGNLAWHALADLFERHHDEAEIERRLGEMAALEGEVFSAFVKARRGLFKYMVSGGDFKGLDSTAWSLELAKHYRPYTRYLEAMILEIFPDLNRELLLNPPPPEWADRSEIAS